MKHASRSISHGISLLFLLTLFGVSAVFLFLGHFTSVRAERQNPLAVGVRVFQNPNNLPAALWYADRCADGTFTKCGQTTPVTVDGYQGVKDKGAVYVNAANLTTAGLYTNIYLFALSEEAGEAGQAVFGEILKNIQFNTNITDGTQRKALRRDVRRREGIAAFSRALEAYRARHSGQVPQLASGSYIRGVTFSTWPSWQATLGADLGAGLPVDPGKPDPADASRILRFVGCGGRHHPETCWDERAAEMRCPVAGYVFGYRALSATDAVIGTTYEYSGTHNWQGENTKLGQVWNGLCVALTGDAAADSDLDGVPSRIDNCPALANGNQKDTDRDGIGDACDACPLDDRNDVDGDTICANFDSCPFDANQEVDSDGDGIDDACDSQFCGDGKKDAGEECDGTTDALRVLHQSCRPNCTIQQLTYCGDGRKQATNEEGKAEACDGTDGVGPHQQCLPNCTLKTLTYCGDGRIQRPNEEGRQLEECDPNGNVGVGAHQRCRANCTLQNLTYCGDGALQNPNDEEKAEQCDTNDGVAAHQKCTNTCTLQTLTHCGDGTMQNPNQENVAEQCEGSGADTAQCTTTTSYAGTKTRNCTATTCQWTAYSACTTTQSCGDGVKNGPEICDTNDGRPQSATCQTDCTGWTCNQGYRLYNNTCELDHCEGSTEESCDIQNGTGKRIRTCTLVAHPPTLSAWGACQGQSCTSGYRLYNNTCELDHCEGSTEESCDIQNGIGKRTRTCNLPAHPPTLTAWGACQAQSCIGGYRLYNNTCELDHCIGNTEEPCQITNGTGKQTRSCNLATNPPSFSPWTCTVQSCDPTFHKEENECVTDFRTCAVNELHGVGTERWTGSTWGACIWTHCEAGYEKKTLEYRYVGTHFGSYKQCTERCPWANYNCGGRTCQPTGGAGWYPYDGQLQCHYDFNWTQHACEISAERCVPTNVSYPISNIDTL